MKPRLYTKYQNEIIPLLLKEGGAKNRHEVPRLLKITLNMGIRSDAEKGSIEEAVKEMAAISGQKPVVTKARQSIANFKLRKGMPVGCKVTLRRERMYEFLDRLITCSLPRIRDFRGISPRKFDGKGSYSIGFPDQSIFPEIELEKIKRQQGLDVTIVTSARNNEGALALLKALGLPFAK
jgi:large subunit ribosomal protein L5